MIEEIDKILENLNEAEDHIREIIAYAKSHNDVGVLREYIELKKNIEEVFWIIEKNENSFPREAFALAVDLYDLLPTLYKFIENKEWSRIKNLCEGMKEIIAIMKQGFTRMKRYYGIYGA